MIELLTDAMNLAVYGFGSFTVTYIALKAVASRERYRQMRQAQQSQQIMVSPKPPRQVEIVSRDLYMEAENLIETHEVLGSQVEQIVRQINQIEAILARHYRAVKLKETIAIDEVIAGTKSDTEVEYLTSKSLKLQEQKCRIESKMLKIMKQLDKIAQEEYKRQSAMGEW